MTRDQVKAALELWRAAVEKLLQADQTARAFQVSERLLGRRRDVSEQERLRLKVVPSGDGWSVLRYDHFAQFVYATVDEDGVVHAPAGQPAGSVFDREKLGYVRLAGINPALAGTIRD